MPLHPWQVPTARRVLDQMADRFFALDGQDIIVFVNANLVEAAAKRVEDFVGKPYWEAWPHLAGGVFERSFRQCRSTHEPVRFQHYNALGSWMDVDAYPEGDHLYVYFRNLTRQRQNAEAAERAAAMRPLIDAIPHIAWASEPSSQPFYLNERWWEYTGLSRDEPYDASRVMHPADVVPFRTATAGPASRGEPYGGEIRLRRADGMYRWHLVRVAPRHDAEGKLVGWVGTSTDVHDHHVADARVARSERELEHLVESIGDALYTLDRSWHIVRFNAGAEAMFGVGREAVIGRHIWDTFPKSAGTEFQARYEEAMATGQSQSFEAFSPTLDRWLDVRCSRYADGIAVVLRDVTARKHAEEEVFEAQERLRWSLAAANAGVWSLDTATKMAEWSPEYRALFGLPQDSSPPSWEEWLSRLHPEDRERMARETLEAVAKGLDFRLEYRILHPERGERWLTTAGAPLKDRPTRITGITYDMTDAKRQVALLEATLQIGRTLASDLEPSRIVQALTDATTAAIGAQFGSFFYATPDETGERFGLYALSGAPCEAFSAFPPVRNTPLFQPTFNGEETVRSGDVATDPRYGAWSEGKGVPEGHLPVRSYLAVPVRARSGGVLGGLLFGHSETDRFTEDHERLVEAFAAQAAVAYENALLYDALEGANKELEERVKERTKELLAANETLRGFTYHVSHDLRTPLRAIVATTRMIEMDYGESLPQDAQDLLARQAEAGKKLGTLIDDLLQLSRLSREEIVKQPIDLTAMVREAWTEALEAHPESQVVVTVEEGLSTKADPRLLRLAVFNLLENAIKYSPAGGTVRVGRVDGEFFVRDEGIGFDPKFAERIFEPFQRLHRDAEFKGTGVGLASVRQVFERHGGRTWAEGRPGEGATVWFTLG